MSLHRFNVNVLVPTDKPRLLAPAGGPGKPYYLNGRPLVGVTSVIHEVLRAPQLEEWFKRTGMQADAIRDEAAAFGKSVHAGLAAYARGAKLLPLDLPESWWQTIDAGRRWIDENMAEIYAVEEPVCSAKYGYAGTPDLYGWRIGHKSPCLVDYKTTGAIYWSHRAQMAAYRQAAKETYGDGLAERIILRFSKDEPGKLVSKVLDRPDADFALFGHLLGAYRILQTGV